MNSVAIRTRAGALVSLSFMFMAGLPAARARDLSLDDRIAAQKAIEQVYWSHRIWPKENPGAKPPLAAVMSDDAIRGKVEDYLRMSALLEAYWHQPITADQLQAELSRMARQSQSPGTLRELFAALHDDPFLIAECLARPTLAARRVEAAFASDNRIHGAKRDALIAELKGVDGIEGLANMDGEHIETTIVLDEPASEARHASTDPNDGAIHVTRSAWDRELARLSAGLSARPSVGNSTLPVGRVSRLVDRADRFIAFAVRAKSDKSVTLLSVSWAKRTYGAWAKDAAGPLATRTIAINPPARGYTLSALPQGGCTNDTWAPIEAGENIPDARYDHTAIWTGSEMIVWGGIESAVTLNTGGRYDPATDSWAASSLTTGSGPNVPTARYEHTAVWTGSEMIVWGGGAESPYTNTGGRYNPTTDAWVASSLTSGSGANVPGARYLHTAVWTGSEMIVWGGAAALRLNTGGRYDPSTDSWAASSLTTGSGANVPSARYVHTAVWTGSEMIVWGGDNGPGETSTGGRYDPTSDSWAASSLTTGSGSNVASARYSHTAVWTGSEMIVWGGIDNETINPNTGGRYDPAADAWIASSLTTGTGANVPSGRNYHTALWTGSEMIVWGGNDIKGTDLQTGGRYDPIADSWSASSLTTGSGANLPRPRSRHSAVWTGSEMIVWGGYSYADSVETDRGGRYAPATDSWTATASAAEVPTARFGHTATWTGAEMVVWGGSDGTNFFSTGGRYDPATNSWASSSLTSDSGANVPPARLRHTAVWTGTEIIVWGGTRGGGVNTGGRYSPTTDSWAESSLTTGSGANVPSARFGHTAVWTGSSMIVWGGFPALNTGGVYDPASDTWVASSLDTATGPNTPGGRFYHSAVWTGSEMIVWGGYEYVEFFDRNDGGRYNPATDSWADSSLTTGSGANVPTARDSHTAVWTGTEMIIWGGFGDIDIVNTGGRYDPATDTWTASSLDTASGPNVPGPRYDHTVVWTGSEMIVWGGTFIDLENTRDYFNTGGRYNVAADTWAASSLTTASGANTPGERVGHSAVWTGSEMIVWGGSGYIGPWNDGGRYCVAVATGECTSDEQCDDGNPCTDDHCNVDARCQHENNTAPCNDGNPCTVSDTCHTGVCGSSVAFFEPEESPFPSGGYPDGFAVGDFNLDGKPDLAVLNPLSDEGTILLGNGFGGFDEAPGSPVAFGVAPEAVAVGDFNADRKPDLAVANYTADAVTILLGNGLGGFSEAAGSPIPVGPAPIFIAVSDVNRDGSADLAVANQGTDGPDSLTILLGDGTGAFTQGAGSPAGIGPFPNTIAAGDFNLDGRPDLVAPNILTDTVTVLLGDGAGGFTDAAGSPFGTGTHPFSAIVGDVNGDGNPDLAVVNYVSESLTILLGNGSGGFVEAPWSPFGLGPAPYYSAIGDFNLDGNSDLAVTNYDSNDVSILLGDGTGRFGEEGRLAVRAGGPFMVAVSDFNLDGRPDVAVTNVSTASVSMLLNSTEFASDGTVCDDDNPCTTSDACRGGLCDGTGGACVLAVDPPNNATNVAVSTNVTLTYHDPIDPATVTAGTFRLTTPDGEGSVPATLTVSSSGTRATLDPTSALAPDTTYRVEATSGIIGPGEEPTQPFTSYFRTGSNTASLAIGVVSEPTDPLPTLAKGGSAVTAAGDLNNDGFQDFVSGAPGYADAAHGVQVEAGAALVYLGGAGSTERAAPDIIFTGAGAHDRSGVSVAGDFDFNGDGLKDILIGAEQVDRATNQSSPTPVGKGKAYLIFFDPNDRVHYPHFADPAVPDTVSLSLVGQPGGIPGVVFEGAALGDQAGFSVAGGGRSTPSAATDIIIGAPGADPEGRTDAGAAYIVFDNPELSGDVSLTRISSRLDDQVPGQAYFGSSAGENVGFSTAFACPLVSADRGTILIGAPGTDGRTGKLIAPIAPPEDPDTTPIIVDAVGTTQPGFQIRGTQPGEQVGWSVASGGDAMEDGTCDVLIGAPTYDVTTGTGLAILADAGRVLHTSQTFVSGIYDADAVGTSIVGTSWQGAASADQLGFAVAGVGDVTGDGYDDVVLGAPFVDPIVGGAVQPDAGAVYVINGSPATGPAGLRSMADVGTSIAGQRLTGTQAGEHAGSSIAGTGDIGGDGRNDFVVGAPDRNNQAGTVYMVLHSSGAAVGNCGPQGCVVADLPTGAEVDVPAGGLTTTLDITVTGLLDSSALPAPAPAGMVLLGAARFTPDGQPVLSPFATIYLPTTQPLGSLRTGATFPLFYFNGTGWVPAGITGTGVANPSYPSRLAVRATADVLRTYAVFVDDCLSLNCDDGNPCTDDGCRSGTGCFHTNNTAPCDDGNLCTTGETCAAGVCTPAFNGLNHPAPKSSSYYRVLCQKRDHNQLPWHGDQLTVADAVCVGQLTATFSGIATIDQVCAVINSDSRPPHGGRHHGGPGDNGKNCDKAENELIATAINICRARVCEEQNLDSHCQGNDNTTVGQSFSEADAILDDALRTKDTCKDASCELKEINNGHALELNSLTLTRVNTSVRLSWLPPELDDGAGSPAAYEVWRRAMGSRAAFTKLGTTAGLSFLDQTAGPGRWEYQVSAVVP